VATLTDNVQSVPAVKVPEPQPPGDLGMPGFSLIDMSIPMEQIDQWNGYVKRVFEPLEVQLHGHLKKVSREAMTHTIMGYAGTVLSLTTTIIAGLMAGPYTDAPG